VKKRLWVRAAMVGAPAHVGISGVREDYVVRSLGFMTSGEQRPGERMDDKLKGFGALPKRTGACNKILQCDQIPILRRQGDQLTDSYHAELSIVAREAPASSTAKHFALPFRRVAHHAPLSLAQRSRLSAAAPFCLHHLRHHPVARLVHAGPLASPPVVVAPYDIPVP
jgi:hypothetical protein